MRLIGRAVPCLALEGGKEVLTQFLWDVILQISGHEELETFIIDGLGKEMANRKRELLRYIYELKLMFSESEEEMKMFSPS